MRFRRQREPRRFQERRNGSTLNASPPPSPSLAAMPRREKRGSFCPIIASYGVDHGLHFYCSRGERPAAHWMPVCVALPVQSERDGLKVSDRATPSCARHSAVRPFARAAPRPLSALNPPWKAASQWRWHSLRDSGGASCPVSARCPALARAARPARPGPELRPSPRRARARRRRASYLLS